MVHFWYRSLSLIEQTKIGNKVACQTNVSCTLARVSNFDSECTIVLVTRYPVDQTDGSSDVRPRFYPHFHPYPVVHTTTMPVFTLRSLTSTRYRPNSSSFSLTLTFHSIFGWFVSDGYWRVLRRTTKFRIGKLSFPHSKSPFYPPCTLINQPLFLLSEVDEPKTNISGRLLFLLQHY